MLSSGYNLLFILILDDTLIKKPQGNMDLILNDLFVWKPSLVPKRFIFNNWLMKGRTFPFCSTIHEKELWSWRTGTRLQFLPPPKTVSPLHNCPERAIQPNLSMTYTFTEVINECLLFCVFTRYIICYE